MRIASLMFVFIYGMFAFAEVDVPQDKRVKNLDSGVCVWSAIENLANIHGIDQLKGIAQYRHDTYKEVLVFVPKSYIVDIYGVWHETGGYWKYVNQAPGTSNRVKEEFTRLNLTKFKIQDHDDKNLDILNEAVNKKLGCAVGLKDYPNPTNYHMVTLTELTKDKFVFIDNNGDCERFEKSREWFDDHWTGFTVLVYPK